VQKEIGYSPQGLHPALRVALLDRGFQIVNQRKLLHGARHFAVGIRLSWQNLIKNFSAAFAEFCATAHREVPVAVADSS
jgi:hypothetical protein